MFSKSRAVILNINHPIGEKVATLCGAEYAQLLMKKFPDGEDRIKVPLHVKGKKVFLLVDYSKAPSELFGVTLLTVRALRAQGAKKVFLIAPYMIYLRQDKEFNPGEVVAGKIFAKIISENFDGVITIDPHLHRVPQLSKFFTCHAQKLTGTDIISEHLGKRLHDFVVIGPDGESKQWVKHIADSVKKEHVVATKKRLGNKKVVEIMDRRGVVLKGRKAIIVDDIISTGHTIFENVKLLRAEGVSSVECYCIHGIFADKALEKLRKMRVKVHATNTIKNPVDSLDVSKLIAQGVKKWL